MYLETEISPRPLTSKTKEVAFMNYVVSDSEDTGNHFMNRRPSDLKRKIREKNAHRMK